MCAVGKTVGGAVGRTVRGAVGRTVGGAVGNTVGGAVGRTVGTVQQYERTKMSRATMQRGCTLLKGARIKMMLGDADFCV